MAVSRAKVVDDNFATRVAPIRSGGRQTDRSAPVVPGAQLTGGLALQLFASQIASRHLDLAARELRAKNQGFYTIGSSGHEGNAAVAAASRHTDMAFLHYRSGAFFCQRATQVPGVDAIRDVLLGMAASTEEPIAGGRHKVFGSKPLNIPPQTSTIASQLPKAVGAAIMLERRRKLKLPNPIPDDSIIICSFGDASLNHSTAAGAINAACFAEHRMLPVPILFVCEDNGIGISVATPQGWVEAAATRKHLHYVRGNGLDLADAYRAASEAVTWVRKNRRPAFLHLDVVRLLGHAGSDVEQLYHSAGQIEAAEAKDPLLSSAKLLIENGWLTADEAIALYERTREQVMREADRAMTRPRLQTAEEVIRPLAPIDAAAIAKEVARPVEGDRRERFWHDKKPEDDKARHLAVLINRTLGDLLAKYPDAMIFGEDVSSKGGVYHVTADLKDRAKVGRVFDTLLDEQGILGLAIGAGHLGGLPIPEIQYLAYFHNACDQIRGEAASLQFFSNGQYQNPMVVRIASWAYQKGFGGHFHNDNSVAALRDIPGIVIASPSRGDDASAMLRTCMAAAKVNGAVVLFCEPIALYMTKDLHEPGDGLWSFDYTPPGAPGEVHVPIGSGRTHIVGGDGSDLTIISWSNGLWMSLRVAKRLEQQHGVKCRVLDIRWINPLPVADIVREAAATGRVLVVDESRKTGGVSEGIFTALIDAGSPARMSRVTSADTFIPLGDAANLVLVQEADIEAAALGLAKQPRGQ
ncbi:MAG: thiamine pyrophosphate-dependent enzyme [Planctomycetota bacterium]